MAVDPNTNREIFFAADQLRRVAETQGWDFGGFEVVNGWVHVKLRAPVEGFQENGAPSLAVGDSGGETAPEMEESEGERGEGSGA